MAGILLVALNLRSAVAALSPIIAQIRGDIPLGAVGVGFLGMLPPICFAVFGIVAPLFTKRFSLESVMVVALVVMLAGHLVRALSGGYAQLAIGSAVVFAGMAVGNVLLPPLVKRYFPDRIGLLTALYATMLSVSTLLPPLVAVPVAEATSWRLSVGMWAVFSVIAIVPWVAILLIGKPRHGDSGESLDEADASILRRVRRAPLAWALGTLFGVSSLNAYACFAWLPELLHETAHTTPEQGGALLSLYAAMGFPASLLIPVLAARMRKVTSLIYVSIGCFLVGDAGLIFLPATATWLWVAIAGLGPLLFPLCLVLINLRTRTHAGSVALSGFVQGFGYLLGALGPIIVAGLHELSGGWLGPLIFLAATAIAAAFAGAVVSHPVPLEDQLAERDAARVKGA